MAHDGNQSGSTDHRETYDAFMSMTKWGIGIVAVALVLLALFLVR